MSGGKGAYQRKFTLCAMGMSQRQPKCFQFVFFDFPALRLKIVSEQI